MKTFAVVLLLLSLVSCGFAFVPNPLQPSLPVNGSLLKTISLLLLVAGCAASKPDSSSNNNRNSGFYGGMTGGGVGLP